ncbi:hypothetical protein RchiOBHm_Chr7g0239411 [Rosa chinensis]|uniref:Uncharacterized protein n=1 Tax=Rosa chinensis TaxID=74649 RepID=A0A2P6PHP2_ROSCH|nr:hypothetical protein RchiOBHm_Chr7g0239411 [Rosa chinensis]
MLSKATLSTLSRPLPIRLRPPSSTPMTTVAISKKTLLKFPAPMIMWGSRNLQIKVTQFEKGIVKFVLS